MTSSGSAVSAKAVKPRRSQKTTVTSRRWLSSTSSSASEDKLGDLGREEAFESAGAFDLRQLVGDALFECLVPFGEVGRLRWPVVQLLHAQHRFDAGDQRRLIDRLRQIFVGAGIEAGHHVLAVGLGGHQDDRNEGQAGVASAAGTPRCRRASASSRRAESGRAAFRGGLECFLAIRPPMSIAVGGRAASPGCRGWSRCRRR